MIGRRRNDDHDSQQLARANRRWLWPFRWRGSRRESGVVRLSTLGLMDTKRHPRCCPACGHHFIPWGTLRISRWTCLPCPRCGIRLKRRIDSQLLLVWLTAWFVVVIVIGTATLGSIAVGLVALMVVLTGFVAWLVDVMTVRLVVAGRWRGLLRGYEV
jgi:hypothetical protein